jgi:hypothetical protein
VIRDQIESGVVWRQSGCDVGTCGSSSADSSKACGSLTEHIEHSQAELSLHIHRRQRPRIQVQTCIGRSRRKRLATPHATILLARRLPIPAPYQTAPALTHKLRKAHEVARPLLGALHSLRRIVTPLEVASESDYCCW